MLLQNKRILISGVAGDIATHSLQTLKENGAFLIGFDRKNIEDSEKSVYLDQFYEGDVMDDLFIEQLVGNCPGIDIVINNIGEGASKRFMDISDDEILYMFQVNCLSAMRLTRAFLPPMINQKNGSIINFSSILSKNPIPTVTHYSSSKAALIGFTRSLAVEVALHNVRVNTLLLGYSNTKNNENYFSQAKGENFINQFIPSRKLVDKSQIGHLLSYLASDVSNSITGSTIVVDRGHTIW